MSDSVDLEAEINQLSSDSLGGLLSKEEQLERLRTIQDIADAVFELQGQRRA